MKGLHTNTPGGQLRLNRSEENDIVQVLLAAAEYGSPLTRLDLRIVIFNYLSENHRTLLFDNKLPGKWWVKHFLDRHKHSLTERSVQNIKKSRAEKTVEEFENYFENLQRTLKDVPPKNILNYDETNLSDNPGSTKCIFKRKVKYPERILNHSKGNISLMFAVSADGILLPIYTVFKSEHLWTSWCTGGPTSARYNRTKSGWFDTNVFEDWFETVVIPWATNLQGPKVVIGDNLSSHLNVNINILCKQHGIRFAFLPANSTHITQPLDVAYFAPLKKAWREILTEYKIKNPSEAQINKSHFPILLKNLLEKMEISNKDNIKAGFKATGIFPLNPNKILRKLPEYEEENKYKIDTVLLDYLKKTRAPNPLKRTRTNKKIKVEPGASISCEDVETLMTTTSKKPQKKENKNTSKFTSNLQESRVTILSDIKLSPYNKKFYGTSAFLNLKTVDPKSELITKRTVDKGDPAPSTSGMCNRSSNKKQKQTKRLKFTCESDSDLTSEDKYSLRDTSEEEILMSESEDEILAAYLRKKNKKSVDEETSRQEDGWMEAEQFNLVKNLIDSEYSMDIPEEPLPHPNINVKLSKLTDRTDVQDEAKDITLEQNKIFLKTDAYKYNETENIMEITNMDTATYNIERNQTSLTKEISTEEIKHYDKTDENEISNIDKINKNPINIRNQRILTNEMIEEEINKEEHIEELGKSTEYENFDYTTSNIDMKTNQIYQTGPKEKINNEYDLVTKNVIVRYYNRKKWKFYVGKVDKVDVQEFETYYWITFLKTIKKPNLKFVINKKQKDCDKVPESSIVKQIKLHLTEVQNEYTINECDNHYFIDI